MILLANHFRETERNRHSERLRQRQWFIKARTQQQKQDEIEDRAEANLLSLAADVALATEQQIQQFEIRMQVYEVRLQKYDAQLDQYDEAVTRALIEQIGKLDALNAQKAEMLDTAFLLEDGRKVFLSDDGSYAVDESGTKISDKDFADNVIPRGKYSAQDYERNGLAIEKATKSIDDLHAAQERIGAAREKSAEAHDALKRGKALLESDEILASDLEDLESEMEDAMPKNLPTIPPTAMKFISGIEPASAPVIEKSFASATLAKSEMTTSSKPMVNNADAVAVHVPESLNF